MKSNNTPFSVQMNVTEWNVMINFEERDEDWVMEEEDKGNLREVESLISNVEHVVRIEKDCMLVV